MKEKYLLVVEKLLISLDSFDQNLLQKNGRKVRHELYVPLEEKVLELETRSNSFLYNSINRKRLL